MPPARLFVECLSSRVMPDASPLAPPTAPDDPVQVGEETPTGTTPTETTPTETTPTETTANDWMLVVGPKDGETGDTTVLYNEMELNCPASLGLQLNKAKATVIQKITITEFWKVTNPEIGSQNTAKEIKALEPLVVNIGIYYEKGEGRTWEGGITVGGENKKVTVAPAISYAKSKFEANGGYTEIAVTLSSDKYKDKDVKVDGVVKWYKISYEYEVKDGQSKFLRTAEDRQAAGLQIAQLENKPTKTEEFGTNVLKARVWTKDTTPTPEDEAPPPVGDEPALPPETGEEQVTPPPPGSDTTVGDEPALPPDESFPPTESSGDPEPATTVAPEVAPETDPLTDPLVVG